MPTKVTVKWMTNLVYGILSVLKLNVVTVACVTFYPLVRSSNIIQSLQGEPKTIKHIIFILK